MAKAGALPLINAAEATFECVYGRGCEGVCCKNGRPGLSPEERRTIEKHLKKFLAHLRPEARAVVEAGGVVTNRLRNGKPMLPVVDGWCAFFNAGCVFHKVGAAEGDAYKYKPIQCALFPLLEDDDGRWYVRQWGYKNEEWDDLFCLNPQQSDKRAAETLLPEMDLVRRFQKRLKKAAPAAG
jgi:Fe-S-cluster containining protein